MMSYKTFMIYTLLSMTINGFVGSNPINNTDLKVQNVKGFLEHIKNNHGEVMSRKLLVDSKEISITDYIETSGATDFSQTNKIKRQEFNKLIKLLSISLSCEYSESIYYLVKLIQSAYSMINVEDTNTLKTYHSKFITPLKGRLSSMILTLAGLIKFIIYPSTKEHDILTILLSWYIYIEKSENNNTNYNIESIKITSYQVEMNLKEFMINNSCQGTNTFEDFFNSTNQNVTNLKDLNELQISFQSKCDSLGHQLNYQSLFQNRYSDLFVVNSDKSYFDKLYDLISKEVPNSTVINELDTNYNNALKGNDIYTILKYERNILQTLFIIIINYTSNILKSITKEPEGSDIQQLCENRLLNIISEFQRKIADDGQPTFLVHTIMILKENVWSECYSNKSFNEKKTHISYYVKNLEHFKIINFDESDSNKFKNFLHSLKSTLICTIIHPAISNPYWQKSYFASTSISEYVIDLKKLHVNPDLPDNIINTCCGQLSIISGTLPLLENKIKDCEQQIGINDPNIKECLTSLKSLYFEFKGDIAEIIVKYNCGMSEFYWKKIFLTLVYNLHNLKSFNDGKKLKHLLMFQNQINDYFNVGYNMTCKSRLSNQAIQSSTDQTNRQRDHTVLSNTKLKYADFYTIFFRSFYKFVSKLVNSTNQISSDHKIQFDSILMSLDDVQERYNNSINLLQENYDYIKFVVRWIISVAYYWIWAITNVIRKPNTEWPNETDIDTLRLKLYDFQQLPIYTYVPIVNMIANFLFILQKTSYSSESIWKKDVDYYEEQLRRRLFKLGLPGRSFIKTDTYNNVAEFVQKFKDTVDFLTTNYKQFKLQVENEAKNVKLEKDYSLMIFREWY